MVSSRRPRQVRIYVEGGGDVQRSSEACRRAFGEFLGRKFTSARPKIIACGSREDAFDDFKAALRHHHDAFNVLLVDSEAPVTSTPWRHVAQTGLGGWKRPSGTTEEQLQLMAQCMEAWFLADEDALERFFGDGFKAKALPKHQDIEKVSKKDLFAKLQSATRGTKSKGRYDKGAHGFKILASLDPNKVIAASKHAKRLFDTLQQHGMR